MKVVILAGGLVTRLPEGTETTPKPMVGIGGRPISWHIMKHFSRPFFYPLSSLPAYDGTREADEARRHNLAAYFLGPRGINLPSAPTLTRNDVAYVGAALKATIVGGSRHAPHRNVSFVATRTQERRHGHAHMRIRDLVDEEPARPIGRLVYATRRRRPRVASRLRDRLHQRREAMTIAHPS
jgi:hypothetical protein